MSSCRRRWRFRRTTATASDRKSCSRLVRNAPNGCASRPPKRSAALSRGLPDLLEQAEARMQANGMQVLWAQDAEEACRLVLDLAQRHQVRSVLVKSKSMLTEEIGLNPALEGEGIEVLETDLGEYNMSRSTSKASGHA